MSYYVLDQNKPVKRFRGWNLSPYEIEEPIVVTERKERERVKNERTLGNAIIIVLKRKKRAMTPEQIWCEIKKSKLYVTNGLSPKNSVSACITQDIKRLGENSKYVRTKQGYYKIKNFLNCV
jgi:hypothetical protein